MKLTSIILFICFAMQIAAQNKSLIKPSILDFHVFYTDFNSAKQLRSNSLKYVMNNQLWSKLNNMQMGLGASYFKGITNKIDFLATVDASYVDYLFQSGATNGSSKFLLGLNTGLNIKLFTDNHTLVPYLSGGFGFSFYNAKTGFYIPTGVGLQFNIFNEAFVFANAQYRLALSSSVNYHFYYSVGIGTSIGKNKPNPIKKISPIIPIDTVVIKEPEQIKEEIKIPVKDIAVTVTDEATGQPLQYVEITIKSNDGNIFNATTNADGKAMFNNVKADGYLINGRLNKIDATAATIIKDDFNKAGNQIAINITHNDPRFTLVGNTVDKSADKPVGNTEVSITNSTQSSTAFATSSVDDGEFRTQLEAASDFVIVGKKVSYISNIENLSTKGLNRSATLYVKLQLGIEEAKAGKSITLKNIYYDLGKTEIRASASTDIDKLLQFLNDNPTIKIEIASHTDSRGSDAANLKLSQARAQAVTDYLMKKGIAKERLQPKGYGETQLVNACGNGAKCTEEQHQQNRRTEFKVVAN